ncbi:MAG: ABC transporter permease [Desulfovibrionaceae bacterium]|nr:ABC transporter permease [Desulfovibrionaceae bacterium]
MPSRMATRSNPDPEGSPGGAAFLPSLELRGEFLCLSGEWTVYTLKAARACLGEITAPFNSVSLDKVSRLDTAGALLINSLLEKGIRLENSNPDFQALLAISQVTRVAPEFGPPRWLRFLNAVGWHVLDELRLLAGVLSFMGELVRRAPRYCRPRSFPLSATVYHLERVGIDALPIVCLLNFLIGLVIAYMAASSLSTFGAQIYVVALLEVVVLREMAVLTTAILVAGRSGSAFTAQLGFMLYNQEVDAMRVMGMDPMITLALPRILALGLSLPCLVLVADLMSLAGGLAAVWVSMDITPAVFVQELQKHIQVRHILVGLVKAPFFAMAIGCVGCFLGFRAKGGADAIGLLTTRSVVESIFLVIALNALFALTFQYLGI